MTAPAPKPKRKRRNAATTETETQPSGGQQAEPPAVNSAGGTKAKPSR